MERLGGGRGQRWAKVPKTQVNWSKNIEAGTQEISMTAHSDHPTTLKKLPLAGCSGVGVGSGELKRGSADSYKVLTCTHHKDKANRS